MKPTHSRDTRGQQVAGAPEERFDYRKDSHVASKLEERAYREPRKSLTLYTFILPRSRDMHRYAQFPQQFFTTTNTNRSMASYPHVNPAITPYYQG